MKVAIIGVTESLDKDNPVSGKNNRSVLSVEDLSVVILDEVEKPKHHQERFTAAY